MIASSPLLVTIASPRVLGDAVTFAWEQSARNPHQPNSHWFMQYPGLDLTAFAPELLLEVFLALQLKVWATHRGRVEIRLPFPIPQWSAAFWCAYHRATNLDIHPLADDRAIDPWPGGASGLHPTYDHVVFFGGGKDSAAAASLLAEIGGPERTLLLSAIAPHEPGRMAEKLVRRRIVEFIHQPVSAATGLPTAHVRTDYLANMRPGTGRPLPFLEFYHAGTLPLLVARGARYTTFGHARNEYLAISPAGVPPAPHRWSGRPETIAAIGAHWSRAYGLDLTPLSACFPLNTIAHHVLLARRYPRMYQSFVSCPGHARPWCLDCIKCFRHGLATLAAGVPTPHVASDTILRGQVARDLLAASAAHDPAASRYLPHPTLATNFNHLADSMSMLAMITPTAIRSTLSLDATRRLETLRAHYDGDFLPQNLQVPRTALAMLPEPLRAPMTAILAAELDIVDDIPDRPLLDGTVWTVPWRVPLHLADEVERLVPDWARPRNSFSPDSPPGIAARASDSC